MIKKFGVLFCVCLAAAVLLSAPVWHWFFVSDAEKLPVLILNKTAEDETLREHKGITWLLNHMKKTKEDGTSYSLADDYSGYVPASKTIRELPSDLSHYSHLYLADSYGVRSNKSGELIYGGMTLEEADRIQQSVKTNAQTIFAEFNTFAEPTEPEARRKLEDLFGLKWTGWTGRYFLDLGSDEVPEWVERSYEEQHGRTYRFSGQGLILVSEKEDLMIVPEKDFNSKHPLSFSFTKEGKKELGLDAELKYNYWFDIMEPAGAVVLASYHLNVNAQTEAKLSEKGVPLIMPAVLHHSGPDYHAYYFAGDYADANDIPDFYQASGMPVWKKYTSSDKKGRTDGFFWKAYVPMMKTILEK